VSSWTDLGGLPPGAHLCRFYRDERDLALSAAAFVAGGLAAGHRVVYLAGDRGPEQVQASLAVNGIGADRALAARQLVIRTTDEMYGDGRPDFRELSAGFRSLHEQARADGMVGLRVAAEMGDAVARFGSLEELIRWERTATHLQQEHGISTVCQYDEGRFTPTQKELLTAEHSGTAPAASPRPLAEFHVEPGGLRVIGELDISNCQRFREVVEARLLVRPRLHLDLEGVTFIDVATMSMLFRLVIRRPEVELVLGHTSLPLRRYLDIVGLTHPRLVLL
jgi:anti-anti-sigma factor